MFKFNTKLDADSLLYSLSYFECDGHTAHTLTQQRLPPPLTSTVRSSLFTHAHSSPLSLAARSHRCRTKRSRYISNGWTFPGQTSYVDCYLVILSHLCKKFATLVDKKVFHVFMSLHKALWLDSVSHIETRDLCSLRSLQTRWAPNSPPA